MSAIRILLIDDHEVVREGLRLMLATQPDFQVVGVGEDGDDAVRLANELRPDVVVMDLEMPTVDGAQAIRDLRQQQPAARIIVLTAFDSDERIIDAIKAGARGYLLKGLPRQELFQAIRIVHEGGSLLQPAIATRLITQLERGAGGWGLGAGGRGSSKAGTPASPNPQPPTPTPLVVGTATFVFTDVRGFTAMVDRLGDEAAYQRLRAHEPIVRQAVVEHSGTVVKGTGDGFMCVFASTRQALRAALQIQRCLAERQTEADRVEIGIGIAAGDPEVHDGDYYGSAVNLASRLCGRARAGQIIVSDAVRQLVRVVESARYHDLGWQPIKGYEEEQHLYLLDWRQAPAETAEPLPMLKLPTEPPTTPAAAADAHGLAVATAPLVGRATELERLQQELELMIAGSGRLVLICGEPGIGKSRLAEELLSLARVRGCHVSVGHGYPGQTAPYLPFVEALRQGLRDVPLPEIERIAGVGAADLAKLLPELGYALPHLREGPSLTPEEEQLRLWESVAKLAERASRDQPVVVLVEDLQWADRASLDLFQYLARNIRTNRVLLLATYRDTDVDRHHLLTEVLATMTRERLLLRLPLRRLSLNQTGQLIAGLLGVESVPLHLLEPIYEATQGTPYFVEEVLRAMIEDGVIQRDDAAADGDLAAGSRYRFGTRTEIRIPPSIREVIDQRLNRLDDATLEVLRAASVIGPAFPFELLQAAAERDEESVLAALERATEARLIEEVPERGEDSYRFFHNLVRQTLYDELNARRRRRYHARIAAALERQHARRLDEHSSAIARHFAEAGDRPRAIEYAIRAADRASGLFAHVEAAQLLERALALLDDTDGEQVADLLERLGQASMLASDWSKSLAQFNRALRERERLGQDVDAARIERRIALMYQRVRFDFATGDDFLQRAVTRLERHPDEPELARAWTDIARARVFEGLTEEALRYARQALDLTRRVGTPRDVLAASMELGLALLNRGEWAEFRAVYEQARTLARSEDDAPTLARIETNLAGAAWFQGRMDDAVPLRLEALRLTQAVGNVSALWYALVHASALLWQVGRWREAEDHGRRAIELAVRTGQPHRQLIWTVEMARGNWPDAVESLQRLIPRTSERRDMQNVAFARYTLTDLSLTLGRFDQAEEHARAGIDTFRRLDYPVMQVHFPPRLAETLALTGRCDEATALARAGLELARRLGTADAVARGTRALGLALAGCGDLTKAHRCLNDAARSFELLHHTYDVARTLELHATHLDPTQLGDQRVPTLADVLTRYESLPAPHEIARVRARLAAKASRNGTDPEQPEPEAAAERNAGQRRDEAGASEQSGIPGSPGAAPARDPEQPRRGTRSSRGAGPGDKSPG